MSSMLEQLWPVFLAEAGEKLDALESLINPRDNAEVDIDALFREFHTLKSSFSMVDFQILTELAHACEDVLHGVRKTHNMLDENIRKCLLEAIDWIKQQLAVASPGRYPGQANDALLARLAPFRPQDEDAVVDTHVVNTTATTIPDKLAEEKEALAVDTLRINSHHLDNLVNNVSQLALKEGAVSATIQNDNIQRLLASGLQYVQQLEAGKPVDGSIMEALLGTFQQYRRKLLQADTDIQGAISNIQQDVLDLRIIPLSTIFNRLPRIVRKKANDASKQVQLVIDGGDVSIDKGMIEVIAEPLIHLLHNAILHGIEEPATRKKNGKPESGTINILASEQGNMLRIEVNDDGQGIDYTAIRSQAIAQGIARDSDERNDDSYWLNFLFTQSLHEGNQQRSNGLDVVKARLSSIGGAIDVHSKPGQGTSFVMRMPVTIAIQSVILVSAAGQVFAIPARNVTEIAELPVSVLQTVNNQSAILLRDNMLPVYQLSHLLQKPSSTPEKMLMLLILQHDSHSIALAIDDMLGRQELFLREIHPDLRNIPGVGGVSLLGNGKAVIILDCENLFSLAQRKPQRMDVSTC